MASLTLNFTPPTTPEYTYVTEYRVKYWPTNTPTNISTVFTEGFPLVITDLTATSYTGTIEAKCGNVYGSPRSFATTTGGTGGTPPACPYKVTIYEDPAVSLAIGAVGNTTGCVKPGYRVKLTTMGDLPVSVTGSAVVIPISYSLETGDCASPTSTTALPASLTIPVGSNISTDYLQAVGANERINGIEYGAVPATIMTCSVTYAGGVLFPGGGTASLATTGITNQFTLSASPGDVVRLKLISSGQVFLGSTSAKLSISVVDSVAYSPCVTSNTFISATAYKDVTMTTGTETINISPILNGSSSSAFSCQLSIETVNGGPNTNGSSTVSGSVISNSSTPGC